MSDTPEEHADGDEAKEAIKPVIKDEAVAAKPESSEIQKALKQSRSSLDGIIDYLPEEPLNDPPKGWTRYVPSIGLSLIAVCLIVHGELTRPAEPPKAPVTIQDEEEMTDEERLKLAKRYYTEAEIIYEGAQGFWNDDEDEIRKALSRVKEALKIIDRDGDQPLSSAFRVLSDDLNVLKKKCDEDLEWDL